MLVYNLTDRDVCYMGRVIPPHGGFVDVHGLKTVPDRDRRLEQQKILSFGFLPLWWTVEQQRKRATAPAKPPQPPAPPPPAAAEPAPAPVEVKDDAFSLIEPKPEPGPQTSSPLISQVQAVAEDRRLGIMPFDPKPQGNGKKKRNRG